MILMNEPLPQLLVSMSQLVVRNGLKELNIEGYDQEYKFDPGKKMHLFMVKLKGWTTKSMDPDRDATLVDKFNNGPFDFCAFAITRKDEDADITFILGKKGE